LLAVICEQNREKPPGFSAYRIAAMKLSQIDATLREIRVTPVKTLGQNFLHDRNLARWIVEKAGITSDDYVVEIGPGLGALTEFALATGARILAVEKDARLANFLRERFSDARLEVRHMDALDFDVRTLFAQRRVKCIGNLPYYVASQLVVKFTDSPSPISLWLFMLQKEMAKRLSAQPGTKEYGALTLSVQARYRVEYLRTVATTVFLPRPEVDSALVRLLPRTPEELPPFDHEMFFDVVARGFSQRRKQLQKLLRAEVPDWDEAAKEIRFNSRARAEELSLRQWIALSNFVRPATVPAGLAVASERFPVVDENDRVLGDASRSKVHGNNLRHRAVHILIFNKAGEVYLQKRSRWKDRHPLLWDSSAAGHVNAGEDYDSAAGRELEEELGVSADLQKLAKLPASERTGQEFIWLYCGRHPGPFRLPPSEIEYGGFFPPAIVSDWIRARPEEFAPGFVECWLVYQKRARQ
jgi:16S rRNA (adenine1518-N6/adenine1519-N6)-dimethyltransferase